MEKGKRTVKEIVKDYAKELHKRGLITDKEYEFHTEDQKGQSEVLELLLTKLYETEKIRGKEVSSRDAFYHFCRFILYKDPASGQEIWNSFIGKLFDDIEHHQYTAIMAPRGHGKSFMVYVLYTLFKSFLFPYYDAVLVSNIPTMNKRNFRVLKRMIESNELLSKKIDYNGKERVKWTETEIAFNKGFIEGISIGSSPRSAHVKCVVGDDPLRDDGRYSDEYYKNFFLGQLLPTIQRYKGRMIIMGTPMHYEDIFHTLMNTEVEGDETVPRPSGELITDGKISALGFYSKVYRSYDEETGEILLPEVFDKEQFDSIRRSQGEIYFQREYMCECVADKTAVFPWTLVKRCMNNEESIIEEGVPGRDYFIGVDVATSGTASADYSAYVVLEARYETVRRKDDEGKTVEKEELVKIVKNIYHVKGLAIDAQVKKIAELSMKFNDAMVLVEQNNVGIALIQGLRNMGIDIESFVTSKYKKDAAIRLLVNEMRQGRFKIPPRSENVIKLRDELTKFGVKLIRSRTGGTKEMMTALSGHDDLVMATAIATHAVEERGTASSLVICQN